MRKRKGSGLLMTPEMELRIKNNCCPMCGLNKDLWNRRKDWRCCSVECSSEFGKLVWNDWSSLRVRAIARDGFKCVKCGDNREYVEVNRIRDCFARDPFGECIVKTMIIKEDVPNFVGDHIKPIALGGKEFDIDNVQTLCLKCNKIKTAKDMKLIAVARRFEKPAKHKYIKARRVTKI